MGEILNKYLLSVFTVETDIDAREHGEVNSGVLRSPHYREEVLEV